MGHFYFIRHGETVWNADNKVSGTIDIALTEKGHQQAIDAGNSILRQGIQADEILCSPLIRAKDTAQHISEITGIPVRIEPRLIEQDFGEWEGRERDTEEFQTSKTFFATSYGGGESLLRLAQRVYNFLDEIREESNRKTYILVSHNGIARMVHSYFYDETNEGYSSSGIRNCEIVRFDF